jgi:hypothetical protein
MNPFADVAHLTVQAWSELDARMEERSCANWSLEEKLGSWCSIELEDYYRQLMHEGCPRPLGQWIGILRRAWIDLSNAPAIDSRGTVQLKFLPGVTEVMEHWIQMSHDGSRYRISTEAYARRVEGQVRVFRTFPECRAGEGGTPLDEARALARPMYCPPLDAVRHLWSVNPSDDTCIASLMRHPIARLTAQHVYVKRRVEDEHAFPVDRDELERLGYAEPKTGGADTTLYAARELAEALLDLEALAAWRRQGLEEDLQERGRSSFSVLGYYLAKEEKETPEQQKERLRRAEEYINGARIFSA